MPAVLPPAMMSIESLGASGPEADAGASAQHNPDANAVRVLIFNDHPVFRSGLVWKIDETSGVQVVCDTASLQDTITVATEEVQYGLDAVVADLRIGDGNFEGVESVSTLVDALPETPVVVCSDLYSRSFAERIEEAGAAAVVQKSAGVPALVTAILEAVSGSRVQDEEAPHTNGHAA